MLDPKKILEIKTANNRQNLLLLMPETLPSSRMPVTEDLNKLLAILPARIRGKIEEQPRQHQLIEVVMDLGQREKANLNCFRSSSIKNKLRKCKY